MKAHVPEDYTMDDCLEVMEQRDIALIREDQKKASGRQAAWKQFLLDWEHAYTTARKSAGVLPAMKAV